MITITTANIFTPVPNPEEAVYVVHGTNCLGVMGAGIAAVIKNLYPRAYEVYKEQEAKNGLKLAEFTEALTKDNFRILNLQTQHGTGGKRTCSYDAIDTGFRAIAVYLDVEHGWLGRPIDPLYRPVIRFPLIGCGLGGGDWGIVAKLIDDALPDSHFIKHLHVLEGKGFPKTCAVQYKHVC